MENVRRVLGNCRDFKNYAVIFDLELAGRTRCSSKIAVENNIHEPCNKIHGRVIKNDFHAIILIMISVITS